MIFSILSACFAILFLLISKKVYKYYFTPLGIYAAIWGSSLVIYFLNPLDYFSPSDETIVIFFGSFFSFCLGCLLVSRQRLPNTNNFRLKNNISEERIKRYILIFGSLGLLGSLALLFIVLSKFGINTYFSDPEYIRRQFFYEYSDLSVRVISGVSRFLIMNVLRACTYFAAILSSIYLMFYNKKYLPIYIPIISTIVFDAAYLGRSHTMDTFIIYFSGFMLGKQIDASHKAFDLKAMVKKLFKNKLIAFFLILFVVLFMYQGIFLKKYDIGEYKQMYSGVEIPSVVVHFYDYSMGPLYTFDGVVKDEFHTNWYGRVTFYVIEISLRPFLVFLRHVGLNIEMDYPTHQTDYQMIPIQISFDKSKIAFFTYLRYFYDDFGFAGTFIFPFLLGAITTTAYRNIFKKIQLYYIALSMLLLLVISWSTILWQLINFHIFYTLLFIFFFIALREKNVYRKITRKI